jgi:hypothetical protein
MNINKIKEIADKMYSIEQDMKEAQLWGQRDGPVTAEQLIEYAKENAYILEMAIAISKEID